VRAKHRGARSELSQQVRLSGAAGSADHRRRHSAVGWRSPYDVWS